MKGAGIAVLAVVVAAVVVTFGKRDAGDFPAKELERHISHLAADDLGGRDTGEDGIRRAEEHIAATFADAGLKPLPGEDDFFVAMDLYRPGLDREATSLTITASDAVTGGLGRNYRPFPFTDEGELESEIVFAGYGITAEDAEWDDYADLDVDGKWVLVLRHTPHEGDQTHYFNQDGGGGHATFTTKAQLAARNGASGMLLVTDPLHHEDRDDFRADRRLLLDLPAEEDTPDTTAEEDPFLAIHISRSLAERLVSRTGRSLTELQSALDDGSTRAGEISLAGARAHAVVRSSDEVSTVVARNVVGYLEGSDPQLRDEWVVIGGHHDHVGSFAGDGDTIFNGADDNASGTTGVMMLARHFATAKQRPRRSLVFATFTAEERGLYGSTWLVREEKLPPGRVAFMLNLDMIGRNPDRPIDVFGDGYVAGLREIVTAANQDVGLDLHFGGADYVGNSDHNAFYEADVPWMFFFTGTHEDYHQVGDHSDKIEYGRMSRILEVARDTVETIANADGAPRYVHNVGWLGTRIELLGEDTDLQATITAVEDDSRGRVAGLSAGDVILAMDDATLESARDVGHRFREIDPGDTVKIAVRRGEAESTVEVERAHVGYLGVFPGPVSDEQRQAHGILEGEGILLRQVTDGGPAFEGGVRTGDILLQISGQPVGPDNLRRHLTRLGAGETVPLTVLRDGERIKLDVTLGERPQRR